MRPSGETEGLEPGPTAWPPLSPALRPRATGGGRRSAARPADAGGRAAHAAHGAPGLAHSPARVHPPCLRPCLHGAHRPWCAQPSPLGLALLGTPGFGHLCSPPACLGPLESRGPPIQIAPHPDRLFPLASDLAPPLYWPPPSPPPHPASRPCWGNVRPGGGDVGRGGGAAGGELGGAEARGRAAGGERVVNVAAGGSAGVAALPRPTGWAHGPGLPGRHQKRRAAALLGTHPNAGVP